MSAIKTPDQRIRVFISSTLQELADERKVIRVAIERLRLIPVMFELGARPHPPRDLYRAYLEQSHIFIGIYWNSYGWVAPGMAISGLEDEYRLSEGKPRLIYVKQIEVNRQPELDHLLKGIQTSDVAYKKFAALEELTELVENDLALLLSERFESGFDQNTAVQSPPKSSSIPALRTPLLGRERECNEIMEMLPVNSLVTITGPGGTGKSRLALEIAHKLKTTYPDGVFFVPLESVQEPKAAISSIAHSIGLFDNGRMPVYDLLSGYLSDKKTLLLLDNFEQILTGAKDISQLQQDCPSLHIIVTSRTPLRIRGEQVYPLEPLPHPDFITIHSTEQLMSYPSIELFIQRARALSPGINFGEENIKAVAEICRRLDGLPLAIELAASHTKYFSPVALAQRMDHVLDLLTRSPQDFPNRQRTMRNTISWSSDLLDEPTRQFFYKLGCFHGSWTLEAADEIAHEDPLGLSGILEHIEKLIDFGLVKPVAPSYADEEPRFILLQTIRDFALEALKNAGILETIAARHAAYFSRLADYSEPNLWLPQVQTWINHLEKDLPNFREAFQWALHNKDTEKQWVLTGCLAQVFTSIGLGTESCQWITATNLWSDEGNSLPLALRARTFYYSGVQEFFSGKFLDSWEKLKQAVDLNREAGNLVSLSRSLTFQGLTGITLRKEDSLAIFQEAMALGSSIGDHYSEILANTFLAETMMMIGQVEKASAMIMKAEGLARQSGDNMLLAALFITKGNYNLVVGEKDLSIAAYTECIKLHQFFSQMTLEGWGRLGIVYWQLLEQKIDETSEMIRIIIELARKSGDLALKIGVIHAMSGFLTLTNHYKSSARLRGAADKLSEESGYNPWSSTIKLNEWSDKRLKDNLSVEEYHLAYEAGKNMTAEKAIEEYRASITD